MPVIGASEIFTCYRLIGTQYGMAEKTESVVDVVTAGAKLPDGVLNLTGLTPEVANGCRVFVHYNGPTDQLSGMCTGMAVLDPAQRRTRRISIRKKNS